MAIFDRNIPYNELPALPPSAEYYESRELVAKLTEASRSLAELKGLASLLPNQSVFVNTIALREAKASSAIENIFTTDDELYQAFSGQDDDYVQGPAKEIMHYREAVWAGYKMLEEKGKLSVETIIGIYRLVKQAHDGIRPYQTETVIKKRGWGSLKGEVIYTPPRGKGVVERMMSDLVGFLNDDDRYPLDPLLKMAMAHYQFEAIHPFRDGNGRTGRILCILYLIQKRLLDMPILYLSSYILRSKDEYYYNLGNINGSPRNWQPWLMFMLDAVAQTSAYTISKINEIRTLMDRTEQILAASGSKFSRMNPEKLFEQPYIRPKNILSDKIKSVNTAKKYLSEMESMGLLSKMKIGKELIWLNPGLMNILSDE